MWCSVELARYKGVRVVRWQVGKGGGVMRSWQGGKSARGGGRESSEELARWERCEDSEVAWWEKWENGEVARWKVPGFIQE